MLSAFVAPKQRPSVKDLLANTLLDQGVSDFEIEFRTKSNEIRCLLVTTTPKRGMDNTITGMIGVGYDITEEKNQSELRQRTDTDDIIGFDHDIAGAQKKSHELQQLVDTVNVPIFGIDTDGNINEWNKKTVEITGYTEEEALNMPFIGTFIPITLRDTVQDVMDKALHGIETSNVELEIKTKSDKVRFLLVNATTRRDVESNIIGVVGIAQDVTEKSRQERGAWLFSCLKTIANGIHYYILLKTSYMALVFLQFPLLNFPSLPSQLLLP